MNNATMQTANSLTHVKIVVVSLVAAILVVGVGVAAHPGLSDSDGLTTTSSRQASGPIIRAGKTTTVTVNGATTIR